MCEWMFYARLLVLAERLKVRKLDGVVQFSLVSQTQLLTN